MSNNVRATASARGGVGFSGLLFLVLLVLKLTNVIDWSWWWITAPLWGGALIVILIFLILFLIFCKLS